MNDGESKQETREEACTMKKQINFLKSVVLEFNTFFCIIMANLHNFLFF